jgi:uncharacterized RDD family membrane protein YckC
VVALLIDSLIFFVPLVVISSAMSPSNGSISAAPVFLVFAAYWLYSALMIGYTGRTVGNMAARTRVVDAYSGGPVTTGKAFGRQLALILAWVLLVLPFIIDCLFPLWDSRNQTLHDKIASTVVVRT